MARKRKWTDEQLVDAVRHNESIFGVLRELGLKLSGGSHAGVKLRIKQLGLDKSHFTGQGWCKGDKHEKLLKTFVRIPPGTNTRKRFHISLHTSLEKQTSERRNARKQVFCVWNGSSME